MKRVRYIPFVTDDSNYQSKNFIPYDIAIEQKKSFELVNNWIKSKSPLSPYDFLKAKLKINPKENFNQMLSFEQMDAVLLAIYNLENNYPKADFIIADMMGNGKGRILAAIARYGFINNRNVLFFTITDGLFSAFYEDLKNLNALNFLQEDIFILHGTAQIYDGMNLVQQSLGNDILKQLYKSGSTIATVKNKKQNVYSNLLLSTYSQINSKKTFEDKIKFLKHFIKEDTIILFDEFHKSIGESTTKESRKQILTLGGSSIRSSATFISKYEHLESYLSFFKLHNQDQLALTAFKDNSDFQLNSQIARYLTKNGLMIRRENQDNNDMQYIDIPEEYRKNIEYNLTKIRQIFYKMFECFQIIKGNELTLKSKWGTFGSLIVRLTNNLILYGKKDYLIKQIENDIKQNKKILIILESTFQSSIEQAIELQKELQNEMGNQINNGVYTGLNYASILHVALLNLFGFAYNQGYEDIDNIINETIELIEQFPEIHLSFIDEIIEYFEKKKENVLEISGRSIYVKKEFKNNQWHYSLKKRKNEDKAVIAHKFNNGWIENGIEKQSNIIILTTAGFTGISLHAHFNFKDQRVRKMIEIESIDKENEKEQALGRHDRLGNVVKPETIGISSGTLFEKRRLAINNNKAQRLKSFTSNMSNDNYSIYNHIVNKMALQFFIENPTYARLIGVYTENLNHEKHYYIDTILKRSILYSNKMQNTINHIIDGVNENYSICEEFYKNNIISTFIDNVKFSNIKKVWEHPEINEDTQMSIQKLNKMDIFDTHLPVIYQVKTHNDLNVGNNDIIKMKKELVKNYKSFTQQETLYKDAIKTINIDSRIFFDKPLNANIQNNKDKLMDLSIGSQITIKFKDNWYYGYVNQISIPSNDELITYSAAYMYELILINPIHTKLNNRIISQKLLLDGFSLLNSEFEIINVDINWDKYSRNNETLSTEGLFLVGNMFYINLFNQILNIGETICLSKQMPNNDNPEFIYGLRLPNKISSDFIANTLNEKELVISVTHAIQLLKENYIISNDNKIGMFFDCSIKQKNNNIGYIVALHNSLYRNEIGSMVYYISEPLSKLLGFPINKQLNENIIPTCFNKENYTFFKVFDIANFMKLIRYLLFSVNERKNEKNKYYFAHKLEQ